MNDSIGMQDFTAQYFILLAFAGPPFLPIFANVRHAKKFASLLAIRFR